MLWVWSERKKEKKRKNKKEKKERRKKKKGRKIYRNNYNPLNKTRNHESLSTQINE